VYRNPLPGGNFALSYEGPKRGHESTPQAGCGDIIEFIRQAHQIDVGVMDRHKFGKRTPMGKTWLELIVTNLMVARQALGTNAAATNKREGYSVANFPPAHIFPDILDDAGDFVAWYMGQRNVRIMPHPSMPVTST
jgi:hypothetical protein